MLSYIIGIALAYSITSSISVIIAFFLFLISLLILSFFISKKRYEFSFFFDIIALFTLFILGYLNVLAHNETLRSSHYTNHKLQLDSSNALLIRVVKRLKPNDYNEKYLVELLEANSKKATGLLLLNLEKDTIANHMAIDDTFLVITQLSEIQKPRNPYRFDYSAYLKQRQVFHQIYTKPKQLIVVSSDKKTLKGYADGLRKTINIKLKSAGFKDDVLAVINALLLGQRQDISPETYNNYANAGTIHILAVSGLHVGIVFLILSILFKPIERLPNGRTLIKPLLILSGLWSFAIIAGLSPSVTRAVTMFSIIAIAQHLKRPTNIYNTLAISAFVILVFQPRFLFDVGFQMSYLAVFSIVSVQPLLYKLWKPKYYLFDKLWQILTVTVAAQLGVAPISLYYFHQFPSLFFVSNIVVIPFLGFILGFGLVVILLVLCNLLTRFVSSAFSWIIETLNEFIAWIAQFEGFLFKDIPFNAFQVISTYLIIISFVLYWKHKSYKYLRSSLVSIILYLVVLLYTKYKTSNSEFVIFNISKQTLLAEKQQRSLRVYSEGNSLSRSETTALRNYKIGSFIEHVRSDSLQPVYQIGQKTLLVVDSNSVYNVKRFNPDYILLRRSPKVHLSRLIDSLNPKKIIADASNYKSYIHRWKVTCEAKKIPFHSTYEKGAIILNLD